MPKETFFNLPDEKRERITAIAIEEFGSNDYADVSISRIVARAGIAKGSFYQYFEDKEDLCVYLLDLVAEKKKEAFSTDQPDPAHTGIFQYMHWIVRSGVQFELANQALMKVGYRAFSQVGYPKKFAEHIRQETRQFIARLVARGKEQGDIAPEIDDELAAFFFETVFTGLGQYLMARVGSQEGLKRDRAIMEDPAVVRILEQTMDILEHGMGARRDQTVAATAPVHQEVNA